MSPRKADPTRDPLRNGTADDAPSELERLLGGRPADPQLAAAALDLRRELLEQYGADSAVDRALADRAAAGYYLQQLLGAWTAAIAESLEREVFRGPDGTPSYVPLYQLAQPSVENALRQVAGQVALQDRAGRLLARSLAALHDRARHSRESRER